MPALPLLPQQQLEQQQELLQPVEETRKKRRVLHKQQMNLLTQFHWSLVIICQLNVQKVLNLVSRPVNVYQKVHNK
jgi:hypothetical protein